MKLLFVHQNLPGQYLHLIRHFGGDPRHQVVFLTQRHDIQWPGIRIVVYRPHRSVTPGGHHYLRDTEAGVLNAQAVARAALDLRASGFVPDLMIGHNGWGEIWYLKDVFPSTPLLGYFEFFYKRHGADVGFDPTVPTPFDDGPRVRTKNLGNLLALDTVDAGQCPTAWQKSLYPSRYHDLLHVIHEGIDTARVKPSPSAQLQLANGSVLTATDPVVTYVARNLEPYRGFPTFMRCLPDALARHPKAQAVIVGGDEVSYGPRLPSGHTFRQALLAELGTSLDRSRVHFLGKVPYPTFLTILQISTVHVYLTQPFVLSWSLLEAMAAECVVVASDTAPVREVIRDGDNGLLVDFFSSAAVSERIGAVLRDRASYTELGRRARQTVCSGFDLNTICLPRHLALIAQLTGIDVSSAQRSPQQGVA
ncbi:glycosyltransferase family 4 protein [Acidiferrobacter thiooxydans]|jgi:glycosyltransferase involved in cell wall biosynthesis|uniref:Glycosyl transferase family 1 n=1 Tax=Acidiferrobacter thiooxydans TaxID=163359 RepID=A0A1C2G487_9GAMM|nr:glycosyltransferase family 4 protein [Acidiferrobacter thiooxydans]RCN55736.1 glycosyl transferase family 1 [Acidiferrobacter thiooxydans]UEO01257.1 glycosyltransferase family 4 protein [Acidiferrobacter thiooxydans]